MTPEPRFIGIRPWFPGHLNRWPWLTDPIPAERVAALRIAAASVLLIDLLISYLPHMSVLFSPETLGGRDSYASRFDNAHYFWSILRWLPDSWGPTALMAAWIAAAVMLLLGWRPLIAGLVVWACAVSFWNINPNINNGGDRLRNTLFLIVAVSCSGAVLGVSSVRKSSGPGPVLVPGWPVKVLFVQLASVYFMTGMYKIASVPWRDGSVMYYVAHDLTWSTAPGLAPRMPYWTYQLLGWGTLIWEIGFPILASMKGTRAATLWIGFIFHLLTFLTLEVSHFALYSMACYAAFVPWERYFGRSRSET